MRKFSNKKIAAVAVAAVALTGTGVAYAYWTTTGSGSGSATAAASNGDLVNKITATVGEGIAPGTSVPVSYKAVNPSATDLFVGTITPTVTTNNDDCLPAWFSIGSTTSNKNVPANTDADDAVALGGATLTMANAYTTGDNPVGVNQDACKSALITISVASN